MAEPLTIYIPGKEVAAAVEAERERCARLVEGWERNGLGTECDAWDVPDAEAIAAAIRRGDEPCRK